MKQTINQIKKSLMDKKISVEELNKEYLKKAKLNTNNSYNLVVDEDLIKPSIQNSKIVTPPETHFIRRYTFRYKRFILYKRY